MTTTNLTKFECSVIGAYLTIRREPAHYPPASMKTIPPTPDNIVLLRTYRKRMVTLIAGMDQQGWGDERYEYEALRTLLKLRKTKKLPEQ